MKNFVNLGSDYLYSYFKISKKKLITSNHKSPFSFSFTENSRKILKKSNDKSIISQKIHLMKSNDKSVISRKKGTATFS